MKIIHVVYSLEIGGAEMLVAQLCRLQRANGNDVAIFAYSKLGALGEALRDEGFEVYVPGAASPTKTMLRYFRRFRRMRPDVVHCHNVAATLQAAIPAYMAGVRSVISTRHSLVAPPYNRVEELKFNVVARFCNWITGICEITCENLRATPLAPVNRIVRVYNGAEAIHPVPAVQALDTAGDLRPAAELTLLFVGRLVAVKNLDTLLRAVAAAVPGMPGLRLWIVGDGAVRAGLERLAEDLRLGVHVKFWGQRMDTAQFFAAADLFVMSSVSEGLPMSLLQAMSVGLPSLCTDVGGMAEVVRLADCGVLVPVGDSVAMGEAIITLGADAELRTVYSGRAKAAYAREFTLERMAAAYAAIYERG